MNKLKKSLNLKASIQNGLGKSNRGALRVPEIQLIDGELGIRFSINYLPLLSARAALEKQMSTILKEIMESDIEFTQVVITGTYPARNKGEVPALTVYYLRATIDAARRMAPKNPFALADDIIATPYFKRKIKI